MTNAAGVGVVSEVSIRDASRNASRPLGVAVVKTGGVGVGEIVATAGKGVTDAEGTLPLVTDGEETIAPNPTLPFTVIRTEGRR